MKKIIKCFKSSPKYSIKWDNYFEIYENIFKQYINKRITFVEVGIGNGGSLFMWRKFFGSKARIIGIELNPDAKKLEKHGFEIFIGDQADPRFWNNFFKQNGKIDILLDDGGHKNIQQITTFMETVRFIKDGGKIIVEDTHTSFMKKKGFKNPSKYSFINFTYFLIENMHRRNPTINKDLNFISKKIKQINFYDSIVEIIISKNKNLKISKFVENNYKLRYRFTDFRHKGNFLSTLNKFEKLFGKINENSFFYRFIRKIFHRNFYFSLKEKIAIKKYIKSLRF
tara:strand:- start:1499 stop:2347 length:849 start_codon:yes stop_codon:yes gene_type:complete